MDLDDMRTVEIEVGWCPACGRQKQVGIDAGTDGRTTVHVGCACGGCAARETKLGAGQTFELRLLPKVRKANQTTNEEEDERTC